MPSSNARVAVSRSRFRLMLEVYGCALAFLLAQALWGRSELAAACLTGAILLFGIKCSRNLQSAKEPLTRRQKRALLTVQFSFIALIVGGVLFLAMRSNTAAAWITFALVLCVMMASGFYGYEQIVNDDKTAYHRAAGDGGTALSLQIERHCPAAPEHGRWPKTALPEPRACATSLK